MSGVFQHNAPAPQIWQAQAAAIILVPSDQMSAASGITGGGASSAASFYASQHQQHGGGPGYFTAATSIQIGFQRPQSIQYPIGGGADNKPIKLFGVPSGSISIGTLIGPKINIQNFLDAFGDPCKPFGLVIKSQGKGWTNCDNDSSQTLICTGCTGTNLQYSIQQAQQGLSIATGQFVISFTGLQWQEGS